MRDVLGDRMKAHEAAETGRKLDPALPVLARIDGRSFSRFTRGMAKPFDRALSDAMLATAAELVTQSGACLAYQQSDEITFVWLRAAPATRLFFDAKPMKLASVLASLAAAKLGFEVARTMPGHSGLLPHFDARVFNVPDTAEGADAVLWRTLDARRNAVSMAARARFPHVVLQGVTQEGMLSMLRDADVDFGRYPAAFREGVFLRRRTFERCLDASDLAAIPEGRRPSGPVMRREVARVAMPGPFADLANRVGFVFASEEPSLADGPRGAALAA